jgi:hypothetical protein
VGAEPGGQTPGALFTTDSSCSQVNGNSYDSKSAVYLDGGPKKGSAAGLDDGEYYVQVTDPRGTPGPRQEQRHGGHRRGR